MILHWVRLAYLRPVFVFRGPAGYAGGFRLYWDDRWLAPGQASDCDCINWQEVLEQIDRHLRRRRWRRHGLDSRPSIHAGWQVLKVRVAPASRGH